MNCSFCEKELTGSIDTYGPFHYPLCVDCWLDGREYGGPMETRKFGVRDVGFVTNSGKKGKATVWQGERGILINGRE